MMNGVFRMKRVTLVRSNRWKLVLGAGLITGFLMSGCIDVPTKKTAYEEELSIHCLLRTDTGPSEIYVERTLEINAPELGVAISGATVRLSGDGQEVVFLEDYYQPGVYFAATRCSIYNGSTYTLDVTDPIGRNVTASTTVPGYFQILSPSSGDTVELGRDIRFSWSESDGAEEYYAHLEINLYEDDGAVPTIYISYTLSDTTLIVPTERIPVEGECWIDVYAVDKNYAGYTRSDPEDPDSPDINHIPGAKGVFGSATKQSGLFYIR